MKTLRSTRVAGAAFAVIGLLTGTTGYARGLDVDEPSSHHRTQAQFSSLYALYAGLLTVAISPPDTSENQENVPATDERQLSNRMHSRMKEGPRIKVGQANAAIVGTDNRALQAAVDYVANLGGGVVEIDEGTFDMHDSLHLRTGVSVHGVKGKTILRKAKGESSPLALDGDFGEEQITVNDPTGFEVGSGVAIWDDNSVGGFHTTVARITGRKGNTFSIDRPLNADCMVAKGARAATVFPVVSGSYVQGSRIDGLTIEGNKGQNPHLNGCRGAGIFFYRGFGASIEDCTVRNYNGDGISFQQSNDVVVRNCASEDNASLGFHPGSGSQRPLIEKCVARRNGDDGLFLCWRVRHGVFQDNVIEGNGRFGISIGHKDTDNLLRRNQIRSNEDAGVCFRDETSAMAGHRNRLEENVIENNGVQHDAPGIRVAGETTDLQFRGNIIRDTREAGARKQKIGVLIEAKAGKIAMENNRIEAQDQVSDLRTKGR